MRILRDLSNCGGGGSWWGDGWCIDPMRAAQLKTIVVPSNMPPWSRWPMGAVPAILTTTNSTINIGAPVTWLEATTALTGNANYAITIPDGTYPNQTVIISIPSTMLTTTQPWMLSGHIANATGILFNGLGWNIVLQWDGTNWAWLGGNASLQH